jgi:hypothetical protein
MLYDFLGTAVVCVNGDGDDGCCDDQLDFVGNGAVAAAGPATDQDGVALPLAPCSGLDGGTGRLGDQLVMEYDFLAAVAGTCRRCRQYWWPGARVRRRRRRRWWHWCRRCRCGPCCGQQLGGWRCWYCCRSSHQRFEIGTTATTTATTHTATLRSPSRHSVRRLATTTRPRRCLFGRIKRPFARLLSRQRHSSKCGWWCHSDCTAAATAATNVTHGGQVRIGGAYTAGCASIGRPIGHGVRGANRSAQQGWIGRHCCSTGSIGCIIRGWRWRRRTC